MRRVLQNPATSDQGQTRGRLSDRDQLAADTAERNSGARSRSARGDVVLAPARCDVP